MPLGQSTGDVGIREGGTREAQGRVEVVGDDAGAAGTAGKQKSLWVTTLAI
jgi:hypothetical protein